MVEKRTKHRRKIQMLDDLYENKGHEALRRTTEDRSTWRKSNTDNNMVSKTCCMADTEKVY